VAEETINEPKLALIAILSCGHLVPSMTQSLKGRVIIVTGGGSGIGRQISIDLSRAGASVSVADVNFKGAQETVSLLQEQSNAFAIKTDVSCAQEVQAAVKATVEKFGRLDGAVNCAGIGGPLATIADSSEEHFDRLVSVNLKGVFLSLKYELEQILMQEKSKHYSIVNISSGAGLFGLPSMGVYSATKHGVVGLTKTAALEYAQAGIRVNAVCPHFIETPLTQDIPQDFVQAVIKSIPLGRAGKPKDISEPVLWLLSDAASFVTGVALSLDGGASAQ